MASSFLRTPFATYPTRYKCFLESKGLCAGHSLSINQKIINRKYNNVQRVSYFCVKVAQLTSRSSEDELSTSSGGIMGDAASNVLEENVSSVPNLQIDAVTLSTITENMVPASDEPFTENDEYDLDLPTKGFSSIPEAIEDIRQGKLVIVVDDEDRENEGDLIMAASLVTPDAMAFIVRHGTGIVCEYARGGP